MTSVRRDLLAECNDQGVPLDQFQLSFCNRCLQQECTRSQFGKSRFDVRVQNWHQDMFTNIPRLDPSDPRYAGIAAQRFLTIDASPRPEVRSAWVDPRDLTEGAQPPKAPQIPAVAASEAPALVAELPPAAAAASSVKKMGREQVVRLPTLNTPNSAPRMIGSAKPTPPKDPWAAPAPSPASGEKLASPGVRVTLGTKPGGV